MKHFTTGGTQENRGVERAGESEIILTEGMDGKEEGGEKWENAMMEVLK